MSVSKSGNKASKIMFVLSLIFKFLFAASFLLMPPASDISLNENKHELLYLAGALFWGSLLLSQITMIFVTIKRRKYFKGKERKDLPKLPAILTFFYDKKARIVDILMIVFLAAFILSAFISDGYLIYVFLFLSVLMIQLHCVVNGKNLIYINELRIGGNAE